MIARERRSEFDGDMDFLDTLKDDLSILENSWKRGKLQPKKVAKHFAEIVESLIELALSEDTGPFEPVCNKIRDYTASVRSGDAEISGACWVLTQQLIDLLKDSISGESIERGTLQQWHIRWDSTVAPDASTERRDEDMPDDYARVFSQEENEMVESTHVDPQELLRKAQEALTTGNGESAKELALKAVQMLAEIESEETKKKERQLKADLETAVHIEAEAEETLSHIKEEMTDREREFTTLNNRLAEARSSLEEKQSTCQQTKNQIEEVETELASLKERHKNLLDQMQEALPARDAADRECKKLVAEIEKLRPDIETLTDSANAAEHQLSKALQKKEEIEAELERLNQKIA